MYNLHSILIQLKKEDTPLHGVMVRCVRCFYQWLDPTLWEGSALFELWAQELELIYGDLRQRLSPNAKTDAGSLGDRFGFDTPPELPRLLQSIQTFYSVLIKLIAWNTEWRSTAKVADSVQPIWPPRDTVKAAPASALGKAPASVTAKPAEPVVPVPEKTVELAPAPKPFVPAIPAVPAQQTAMELPGQETVLPEAAPWRIAGEVLNTYIICEDDAETLWLIDKHAAHERMNFDRLMTSKEPPMRQTLLQPIAVEPGKEDAALLLDNLELLEQFGFGCEDFGDGAILVREVPADLDAADTAATLEEFAQNLRTGRNLDEKREALLHTMACKAAIKGGWTSDPAELKILVEKVQSGEVRYCPHGRPVVVKVTKYELEKLFKRA